METREHTPMQSRFDDLLDSEIARLAAEGATKTPPASKQPLTMEEYMAVTRGITPPTKEQLANFIGAVQDDRSLVEYGRKGYKVLPVLMPHEHGFPAFEEERLRLYGHLYYYVLDEKNLTVRVDKQAFMDAVLPPEVIGNAVPMPDNIRDPEQAGAFYAAFEAKTREMLGMVYDPGRG